MAWSTRRRDQRNREESSRHVGTGQKYQMEIRDARMERIFTGGVGGQGVREFSIERGGSSGG
jgi:hypothetical protein